MTYYMLGMFSVLIPFIICGLVFFFIVIKEYRKSEYFMVTRIPYFSMRSNSGHTGEYDTYKYLMRVPGKKRFLFNCYIPADNGTTTEIDVLMIHESGIFVFESKNYSGWIFGSETQKLWTQSLAIGHGKGKTQKESFFNPIWQNKKHIKWLQEYLNDYPSLPYYSYIVFSERCEIKKLTLKSQEHVVTRRNNILSAVSARIKAVPVLSPQVIDSIYKKVYPLSQADSSIKMKHIQNIQNASVQVNSQSASVKKCPRCNGKLLLRTASKGQYAGKQFYGCSNYPQCRYIENRQMNTKDL